MEIHFQLDPDVGPNYQGDYLVPLLLLFLNVVLRFFFVLFHRSNDLAFMHLEVS